MTDITRTAISANLHALGQLLDKAQRDVTEGIMAIDTEGNQNGAIGCVMDLDRQLESALALVRAALALHRSPKSYPSTPTRKETT